MPSQHCLVNKSYTQYAFMCHTHLGICICNKKIYVVWCFLEPFDPLRINVYFNEATGGRYVPRAVLMDLDTRPSMGVPGFFLRIRFVLWRRGKPTGRPFSHSRAANMGPSCFSFAEDAFRFVVKSVQTGKPLSHSLLGRIPKRKNETPTWNPPFGVFFRRPDRHRNFRALPAYP